MAKKERTGIEELLETPNLDKGSCPENITYMGESLLASFGLNIENPLEQPDFERGLTQARAFLTRVCTDFKDPTHIIRIAPFAHAYLGPELFARTLDIVAQRARTHPKEQSFLDEVFSGAALVAPEHREHFLQLVKEAKSIDGSLFGLSNLVLKADRTASFTALDEFPREFRTSDVNVAMNALGAYIQHGLYQPGSGFTSAYRKGLINMGSFDFLFKNPSPHNILVITDEKNRDVFEEGNKKRKKNGEISTVVETTPSYDARPRNNGENPSVVLVNLPFAAEQAELWYHDSTVLYVARTDAEWKVLSDISGGVTAKKVIDARTVPLAERVNAHLNLIQNQRQKGVSDFGLMLDSTLAEAARLLEGRNDAFYDVQDTLTSLGRRADIDAIIAERGIALPPRLNYNLVVVIGDDNKNLSETFNEHTMRKKVRVAETVPPIEEMGTPFVIISAKPLSQEDIYQTNPAATVLYFANNDKAEEAIRKANDGQDIVVVNAQQIGGRRYNPDNVGHNIERMLFSAISQGRKAGKTAMPDIMNQVAEDAKQKRDRILFSHALADYPTAATAYWNVQQQLQGMPQLLQLTDGVLMQACPTGGCFELRQPDRGGCCGGGNLPGVLIDFAIAYRKTVGNERFMRELTTFHKGDVIEPWYLTTREYQRHFKGGLDKKAVAPKDDMTF